MAKLDPKPTAGFSGLASRTARLQEEEKPNASSHRVSHRQLDGERCCHPSRKRETKSVRPDFLCFAEGNNPYLEYNK